LNKTGYRVVSVSGYYENNAVRFAAVWVKDGCGWVAHHGMTGADYSKQVVDLRKKGFRVSSVSGYSESNNVTHFAAVWVADKTTTWVERHDLTEPEYRQAYDELRPKGYRPVSISFYYLRGSPRYAVVFAQGAKDYWEARHNLTRAEYQAEFDRWTRQGGRPLLVIGCTYEKTNTYAAVFVGDTNTHDALVGKWASLPKWPIVAIHAALLHDGTVLAWPRLVIDSNPKKDKTKPPWTARGVEGLPHTWDHQHPNSPPVKTGPPPYNIFCSGHAFLPDGRLFVAGGHMWDNFWGDGRVTIYDPKDRTWAKGLPAMNLPRWYPSCVTLPSGDILVDGGTFHSDPVKVNRMPQVWLTNSNPRGNPWRDLKGISGGDDFANPVVNVGDLLVPFYPFLHVALSKSYVFRAGPNARTGYLDTAGAGKYEPVAEHQFKKDRDYGSSVMYEPGKVLVVGGSWAPTNTAEVIDLIPSKSNPVPKWQFTQPMGSKRRHLNATLLADGTVFASGGTATNFNNKSPNDALGAVLDTETWDPKTGHWTPMAAQGERRLYHSIALLLPDGKVLSAGGGEPNGTGPSGTPKDGYDKDHFTAQVYWPPYLFRGPQPVITGAPAAVKYGQKFVVKTPDAAHIPKDRHVTWIRLGSATHARNFDQRCNYLTYQAGKGSLTVTAPANGNLAPPGYYMLFILNEKGVPSKARIIHLG
jgi:hypothetical protein